MDSLNDSLNHQSDDLPDDARQSGSPPAALPTEPLGAWPLKAEPYDASEDKNRNSGRKVLIGTIIVYLVLVAIGVPGLVLAIRDGETLSHSSWRLPLFGFVTWGAFIALVGVFVTVKEMRRVASLPDGGLILTEQSMLDTYGTYGLAEIRLATPTVTYDDDESEYNVHRNGFEALWYDDGARMSGNAAGSSWEPSDSDDDVRSYALWWRDDAYPDLERDMPFSMNDMPYSDTTFVSDQYMKKFRREGVDLRMWPCVLEVSGDRGRLLFDPAAEKTACGPRDPLITEGIETVYRLR